MAVVSNNNNVDGDVDVRGLRGEKERSIREKGVPNLIFGAKLAWTGHGLASIDDLGDLCLRLSGSLRVRVSRFILSKSGKF